MLPWSRFAKPCTPTSRLAARVAPASRSWGLPAVEAAEGRSERAVAIAAAAQTLSTHAGVVIDHPMDPSVVERIEALKASIPKGTLSRLVEKASVLTPAAVLAMVDESGGSDP